MLLVAVSAVFRKVVFRKQDSRVRVKLGLGERLPGVVGSLSSDPGVVYPDL